MLSRDIIARAAEAIEAFDRAWVGCDHLDCLPSCRCDTAREDYYCGRSQEGRAVAALGAAGEPTLQDRVQPWMTACFGPEIASDRIERNHRFLEEAIELVQACGCTAAEAHQLVDYVYARPVGEPDQEVGGVQITLAALCLANGLDMHAAGERELARIWTKVEQIRAKQASKLKRSPLPQAAGTPASPGTFEIGRLQAASRKGEG
jgi:hypothetical protein